MLIYATPPFTDCSVVGDRRFSAFCAKIRSRGNHTIEEIYQASEITERADLYRLLWREFVAENPGAEIIDCSEECNCFGGVKC